MHAEDDSRSRRQSGSLKDIEKQILEYETNLVLLETKRSTEKREKEMDDVVRRHTITNNRLLSNEDILDILYRVYKTFKVDDDEPETAAEKAEKWYRRHKLAGA